MSWNFKLASKTKSAMCTAVQAQTMVPQPFKDMVCDQVNAMSAPQDGEIIVVESSGHVDALHPSNTGGNGQFHVYHLHVIG